MSEPSLLYPEDIQDSPDGIPKWSDLPVVSFEKKVDNPLSQTLVPTSSINFSVKSVELPPLPNSINSGLVSPGTNLLNSPVSPKVLVRSPVSPKVFVKSPLSPSRTDMVFISPPRLGSL